MRHLLYFTPLIATAAANQDLPGLLRRPTMRTGLRSLTTFFAAAGVCAAIAMAPAASAAPECTTVAPNTTQCETNGSAQIVTSPQLQNNYWGGWPYGGGLFIGTGGWGWG
jgi:hypothetical protein